jgi:hypothetical protein
MFLFLTKWILALIEEQGLRPIFEILKKLGGWPVLLNTWSDNFFDWKNSVYVNRKIGYSVDYFLSLDIDTDPKNSSKRIITVSYLKDINFITYLFEIHKFITRLNIFMGIIL